MDKELSALMSTLVGQGKYKEAFGLLSRNSNSQGIKLKGRIKFEEIGGFGRATKVTRATADVMVPDYGAITVSISSEGFVSTKHQGKKAPSPSQVNQAIKFFKSELSKDPRAKVATSPDQWELAGEILEKGVNHPAFAHLTKSFDKVTKALDEAKKRSMSMRRTGVGRTEDPNLIAAMVIPELENYQKDVAAVIKQIKQRIGIR